MKKIVLLLALLINSLIGKEILFPINSYSLKTNEIGYFLYDNKIVKYKVTHKNLEKKEICIKSLTKDVDFTHQCEAMDIKKFKDVGLPFENIRFEIKKQMFLSIIEKLKRHDEYICDFGFINIKNKKFNLLVNIEKFNSVYLDSYSFEYYKKNKEKVLSALKKFFDSRITGDFCRVNPNLIYKDNKNKPFELLKSEGYSSNFDGFEFQIIKNKLQ